jgi:hypothetical protein
MFQIFGSQSSRDYDLLVFVDQLGTIVENKAVVKSWEEQLRIQFADKPLNVNLGILEGGRLIKVFKGTVDEVNNSLLDTYGFHQQSYPQQIKIRVARDIDLKILRGLRIMLSMLSRTQYRSEVKKALQGDLTVKYQTLQGIDLSTITDLGSGKNMSFPDYYKTMSFQLGQMLGLLSGIEFYTKEHIAQVYPDLQGMLTRQGSDSVVLESYKQKLLGLIDPAMMKYQKEELRD